MQRQRLAELGRAGAGVRAGVDRRRTSRRSARSTAGRWCSRRRAAATTARGVWVVVRGRRAELAAGRTLYVEQRVPLRARARRCRWRAGRTARCVAWPLVETVQQDGICVEVIAPAPRLSPALAADAGAIAMRLAEELDVTGVLAVELFETRRRADGQRARDAPAQLRPLDDRRARAPASSSSTCARCSTGRWATRRRSRRCVVMVNLLGGETDRPRDQRCRARSAQCPRRAVHLYGKAAAPGPQARARDRAAATTSSRRANARATRSPYSWGTSDA